MRECSRITASAREPSRAEAVMREHSRIAQTNLRDAVSGQSQSALPGVQLIRRR